MNTTAPKVDAMIYEGGWLLCLRIGDEIGLVCLAGPSKSSEKIDFANAFGRAAPATKERFGRKLVLPPHEPQKSL